MSSGGDPKGRNDPDATCLPLDGGDFQLEGRGEVRRWLSSVLSL